MATQQQMIRAVVKNTFVDMISEAELDQESRRRPRAATCDGILLRDTEGKSYTKDTSESLLFTCTFGDPEPECEPLRSGSSTPGTPEPEPSIDSGRSLATQTMDCLGQTQQLNMSLQQPVLFCDTSTGKPVFYNGCYSQDGMLYMVPVASQSQFVLVGQQQQQPMEALPTKQQSMQQQHNPLQQHRMHQREQQQCQQRTHHQWQQQQQKQQHLHEALQRPHPHQQQQQQKEREQEHKFPEHLRTTVMLRNIPSGYSSEMLKEMLDHLGFAAQYDFLYLPIDFRHQTNIGYAFVNMRDPAGARRFRARLAGFDGWAIQSNKVCEVSWSHPQQGLAEHIERYRNSPVMHESMPMEYKPRLFRNGQELPFPPPTRAIKPVKLRKAFPMDDETSS